MVDLDLMPALLSSHLAMHVCLTGHVLILGVHVPQVSGYEVVAGAARFGQHLKLGHGALVYVCVCRQ
jgi:hypothetical protein